MAELTDALREEISAIASGGVFPVWFLIGAALVFFMQGGFAMVETGFTRAKNAGNIIMKNLMDFCIGTVCFVFLGFSLMCAEDYAFGFIGVPNLGIFTDFANFDFSGFVFNLVFCATAATIVSGAMAERTKFSAYCLYSAVISLVVYPIEAGWVWNSQGWLFTRGYIDFAGSSAIHMVGGITSFIGAAILGPRIGKYVKDKKTGKKTSRAIPGHSITLGALGCFILWFGWYGFNGAAAGDATQLGSIFLTTTVAPGVATVVTMCFTWIKNGKPDVSMSLNGALAGLVAITAPCANVNALGALIIGAVAGILVVVAVEVIDFKCHVDDPVGAIAVHGVNGIWGTIAAGLFAASVPDGKGGFTEATGLLYGGGFAQLGTQIIGVIAIAAWTIVTMTIVFKIIKSVNGLRVTPEEEIMGLDGPEHGLPSAYGGFLFAPEEFTYESAAVAAVAAAAPTVPADVAIPVKDVSTGDKTKLTKVSIVTNQNKFAGLQTALDKIGITGLTITNVLGYGMQKGHTEVYRGVPIETKLLPKIQVDIVVSKVPVDALVKTAKEALYTGNVGDGKIFIYDVENVIKVRTGEEGYDALQDE
ncbi:MAG: ammonium transporter [Oscillospiraceae bacterium]|jgi:Amt family ammonium transporter|nr:ammonium transporter [Oscillospiraceae bacterium]